MCWISKTLPVKHIAGRDFTVYKSVMLTEEDNIISTVFLFKYKLFKLYQIPKLIIQTTDNKYVIKEGFHSYRRLHKTPYSAYIVCIIPKGAIYYKNKEEIVSNKLIPIKLITT